MKKQIYRVHINQEFDSYQTKLFKKEKIFCGKGTSTNNRIRYILALDSKEAVQKYHDRYKTDYNEIINEDLWRWYQGGDNDKKVLFSNDYDNFHNIVVAELAIRRFNFNTLKEELDSEDFFEYIKQEMYPIEILMKD